MESNKNDERTDDSTALPEEARQCNPSLPIGMEDDANRMRGDAIGNTLYSECWVIKILMKLTKFCSEDWSEDMETELCLLWDMAIEPDVVQLLMQHNYLELTSQIIHDTTIPRLTEILVGIIGNLSCVASVRTEITKKVNIIRMLLELLSIPDVPTLLQLMRLLQTCFQDLRNADTKSTSSSTPEELTVSQENRIKNAIEPEMMTEYSELDRPLSKLEVDVKEHENSCTASVKQLEHVDNLPEKESINHDTLDEVSRHFHSCVMGLERSRLNSCTLHEQDNKGNPSHARELERADCGNDNENNRTKHKQLELRGEKIEVDSVWLQELCDGNKWLPSIIFILRSSTNGQLLCSTLALLDTLCYVPINNDLLGRHIASPDVVLALIETLEQLHHEYNKNDDLCQDVDLEKAVCHWAAVLSAFTSFPEGKVALGCHAEALCASVCKYLVVDKIQSYLSERQAEFIMLIVMVMTSLLEDMGYFHPPTFNCFLSILTYLQDNSTVERRNGYKKDEERTGYATWEVQQEVIRNLEKYFVDVVQRADGEALACVLQHCKRDHIAILQSVMGGQKST